MKYFKAIVIALLAISLLINVRLLTKMNVMEERIYSINYEQSQLTRKVENQSSSLYYALESFKDEQRWISSIRMNVDTETLEDGGLTLFFDWQIKEWVAGSEVKFHYKFDQEREYRTVSATELGNGRFHVPIPLQLAVQPQWYIGIHNHVSNNYHEEMVHESFDHDFSYYVTVKTDDLLKSSEIVETNIGYLGASYYGQIDVHGSTFEGGYDIQVNVIPFQSDEKNKVKDVYLKSFRDGVLLEENLLTSDSQMDDYPYSNFHTNASKNSIDYTKLVLKVVYSNGKSFEKELFRK